MTNRLSIKEAIESLEEDIVVYFFKGDVISQTDRYKRSNEQGTIYVVSIIVENINDKELRKLGDFCVLNKYHYHLLCVFLCKIQTDLELNNFKTHQRIEFNLFEELTKFSSYTRTTTV